MTTDPRIAVLSALSSPDWHPIPEAHGMPWGEAEQLLAAYDASRAVVPAVAPATDQAALRARFVSALDTAFQTFVSPLSDAGVGLELSEHLADAVLSVLPAPADRATVLREAAVRYERLLADIGADTAKDPRYWTGVQHVAIGLRRLADECPQCGDTGACNGGPCLLRRMAVAAQQPSLAVEDCTCIPFTRQGGVQRYCQPGDTVDMISGWEIGGDCPHHRDTVKAQPECTASRSGHCLREAESETACDTEDGECVHGGKPAVEAQADCNSGVGWYEVVHPRNATTCIAYAHEDGSLYLPEGDDLTPDEFAFAAARGNAHRLVRADEAQQPKEARS